MSLLKRKSSHFPKKNTELVGIEVKLNYDLPRDMKFNGYMDVVLHNTKTGRIKIIDIKTGTHGWNKYMKLIRTKLISYYYTRSFSPKKEIFLSIK